MFSRLVRDSWLAIVASAALSGCAGGEKGIEPAGAGQVIEAVQFRTVPERVEPLTRAFAALGAWLEREGFRRISRDEIPRGFSVPRGHDPARAAFYLGAYKGSQPFLVAVRLGTRENPVFAARVSWFLPGGGQDAFVQQDRAEEFAGRVGTWWAINDPYGRG